ncbi:hypothetical protein H4Q26_010457 [Puccinia striiformis f. sp. tritici PST-130]|nr:hypothetical protein H4Q26_010457 [Puccinia striiformis f. sp. tritici PST-130]
MVFIKYNTGTKNPSSNGTTEEEKHHSKLTDTQDANHHPDFYPASTKKKSIPGEKDAVNPGFSSMRILLDWITAPGNFKKWRGKKGSGVSKEFLANEILQKMAAQGINHRIARDIRTKIQEIQSSFITACDFLRNTGQGLLAEDIANGTNDIRAAVLKKCKYYYDLEDVMGERENANPRDTVDSTSELVPNLNADNEPEANEEDRPDPLLLWLDENNMEESDTEHQPEPTAGVDNTSSRLLIQHLPQGLEKAINDTYEYRYKNLKSKEQRDKDRLQSEDKRDRKRLKLEKCRQVAIMKDLKDTGFSNEHIKSFLDRQFGKRATCEVEGEDSDSHSDSDSD